MATLSALKFNTVDGADQALTLLTSLQKQELIQVLDAAVVSWPADKKKPKTRQLQSTVGAGALGGAFWGMLFGLLFFIPFLGMAIGAAMGALMGNFTDYGIDDNFIKSVREKVTPGTSALFLLSQNAVTDRVVEAMKGLPTFEVVATNLSKEQEDKLRAEFGEEE
jgi:uncharacterized membrane protein